MTQLHTINSIEQLAPCRRFLNEQDALLLIEDGVYCLNDDTLASVAESVAVYFLQDDAKARGIDLAISERATPQTYADFVQLCTQHAKIINWF